MTTKTDAKPRHGANGTGQAVSQAGGAAADLIRKHPLLVVAGGLAVGAIAATFLPRGTGRRLARHAMGLAEVAGTAGALLGARARETAGAAGSGLREQGALLGDRLDRLGDGASERFGQLRDAASSLAGKASAARSRARH